MADSNKGPIGGTFEDFGETVVKPVMDEVGKMIEIGVQSVKPNQTPNTGNNDSKPQPQPAMDSTVKTPEEQKKIQELQFYVKRQKEINDEVEKVRKEREKKELDAKQTDHQQQKVKQFEIQEKKQKNIALEQAQKRVEVRGGVGG